jgi:hypothetical protein
MNKLILVVHPLPGIHRAWTNQSSIWCVYGPNNSKWPVINGHAEIAYVYSLREVYDRFMTPEGQAKYGGPFETVVRIEGQPEDVLISDADWAVAMLKYS